MSGNKDCPKEFLVQHPDVILTVHVHKPNNTQQGFNMKVPSPNKTNFENRKIQIDR